MQNSAPSSRETGAACPASSAVAIIIPLVPKPSSPQPLTPGAQRYLRESTGTLRLSALSCHSKEAPGARTPPPGRPTCWPLHPPTTGSPACSALNPKWRCARGWQGRAAPEIAPAGTMRLRPLPLVVVPGLLQLVSARPLDLRCCPCAGMRFGGKSSSVRDLGAELLEAQVLTGV